MLHRSLRSRYTVYIAGAEEAEGSGGSGGSGVEPLALPLAATSENLHNWGRELTLEPLSLRHLAKAGAATEDLAPIGRGRGGSGD